MTRNIFAAALLSIAFSFAALAQMHGHDMGSPGTTHGTPGQGGAQTAQAGSALAEGEVRRVDKGAGKLTIRHGPIANLDMPAMTMVFQVKDPAMLDQVKAGDRIRFAAENIGGQLTVTRIDPVK